MSRTITVPDDRETEIQKAANALYCQAHWTGDRIDFRVKAQDTDEQVLQQVHGAREEAALRKIEHTKKREQHEKLLQAANERLKVLNARLSKLGLRRFFDTEVNEFRGEVHLSLKSSYSESFVNQLLRKLEA